MIRLDTLRPLIKQYAKTDHPAPTAARAAREEAMQLLSLDIDDLPPLSMFTRQIEIIRDVGVCCGK